MKYYHVFKLRKSTVSQAEFEALCRLRPEGRKEKSFQLKFVSQDPTGDECLRQIIQFLRERGVNRQMHSDDKCYGYYVVRNYEKGDFDSAGLLLLHHQRKLKRVDGPERDEEGRLLVSASDNKSNLRFGSTFPNNHIVVSDAMRKILDGTDLVGLDFKTVTLRGRSSKAVSAPPWELNSLITLPKLANTLKLMHYAQQPDSQPQPFQGDYSSLVFIKDEPFFGAELHYRSSDLAKLEQFDIACTMEKVRVPHPLVISQRFYQYCLKQRIRLEVEPVRVDPD